MYFFLMFGMPLGFLLLALDRYPESERPIARKAFILGLAAFVPTWLFARLLGTIVPPVHGSFLQALHEWADRMLPYAAAPGLAYLVFYRPSDRLAPGIAARRLTAFYAGALAPVGVCETARLWGSPEPYALFILPFLLGAICVAMPKVAMLIHARYGFALAGTIALALAATLAAALCPFLFLVQLWPLALLDAALLCAGAWLFASRELGLRPPIPVEE